MKSARVSLVCCASLLVDINRVVRALRFGGDVEREWLVLRGRLNVLARLFRMPELT